MAAGSSAKSFQVASRCSRATSCVRASGNRASLWPLKLSFRSVELREPMSAGSLEQPRAGTTFIHGISKLIIKIASAITPAHTHGTK